MPHDNANELIRPRYVIAKQSFPRWYELHLRLLHWGIKRYQRNEWGKNWGAVHVYVVLPAPRMLYLRYTKVLGGGAFDWGYVPKGTPILFEQTYPVGKWTHPNYLHDKTYAVCSWDGELDVNEMNAEAREWVGKPYDLGDLADIAISGFILGIYKRIVRFAGDKARRFGVCSTVAAHVLNVGGCSIERPLATSPAYFEGNGPGWKVVRRVVRGKVV